MDIDKARQEVIEAGHALSSQGLVARTWGNVSCRVDAETFVITPSGIAYDRLVPEYIVPVRIADGSYDGDVKPSSEKGIHAEVYAAMPDVNFIIHTHQTYATCVSVAGASELAPTEDEAHALGGLVKVAAYAMPGTAKLRANVMKVIAGSGAVLMERHGALLTGISRDEAFAKAACLEEVCKRVMPCEEASQAPDMTISRGDELKTVNEASISEDTAHAAGLVCADILKTHPEISDIYILKTPAIEEAMRGRRRIAAVLDDYAQIIGVDAYVANLRDAAAKLKTRSAVYVPQLGVICCAGSSSDCDAIMKLAEKNALAVALAAKYGKVKAIPYYERFIMRRVYVNKYSKMK